MVEQHHNIAFLAFFLSLTKTRKREIAIDSIDSNTPQVCLTEVGQEMLSSQLDHSGVC